MGIISIRNLAGDLQWDKSNLWDISIEGLNFHSWPTMYPVGTGMPANDIQLNFFGVLMESIGNTGLSIPYGSSWPTLSLSFIDDEQLTVFDFFKSWMYSMAPTIDGYRATLLNETSKSIVVSKLNHQQKVERAWTFRAFPTGGIEYHGDSSGDIKIYTINFNIVSGNLEDL